MFSEAELARRGELGARPLSQLSIPHFWLDLMLVHRTKGIPLPSFKLEGFQTFLRGFENVKVYQNINF